MAGIGTAAKNWKEEEEYGIGTAATRTPGDGQGQGIGTAATRTPGQDISTPAAGVGTAATRAPGDGQGQGIGSAASRTPNEYAAAPQEQQPIKVMEGVTAGTQQKLNQAQQGYQPGTAAQQAMQQLQQLQANKPGSYSSQYTGQMQGILQEITGQKPFQYSISQDALFQSLSDYYQQQAKQASMNAQGQAVGLTGGYGNSAAQAAGSQAYQQAILPMYDKALDTARFAYDVYQGNQNNRLNQLQALQSMDEMEYGRNRDELGDWERERDYQTGRYDTEEERGYNRYLNDLNYYTQLAQIENADYRNEQERQEAIRQFNQQYDLQNRQFQWQQETDQRDYDRGVLESDRNYALNQQQMQEQIRQFNESLDWDKMSAQQKYAAEWVMQTLANGQMPSEELLEAAGLSAADAQKLMAQATSGGTGGRNTWYLDKNGNPYKKNSDGTLVAADPSELKRGDQFIENADNAIGISQLVTGIQGIVKNKKNKD